MPPAAETWMGCDARRRWGRSGPGASAAISDQVMALRLALRLALRP